MHEPELTQEQAHEAAADGERLPHSRTIELRGHIIDSHILAQVMDLVMDHNAEFYIEQFDVGRNKLAPSYVRLALHAATPDRLDELMEAVGKLGAQHLAGEEGDACTVPAPADGVLPDGFYCTTNMPTQVRIQGRWVPVEMVEMDVAIAVRVAPDGTASDVYAVPMADVRAGTPIVVGYEGVRVLPVERPRSPALLGSASRGPQGHGFSFMSSAVSTERPKAAAVAELAEQMRRVRAAGGRTLIVGGPAIVHTGAGPQLASLIREGYVSLLFAGNALATHDIEAALYGTSLGVSLDAGSEGAATEHGHEHHLRAINTIRGCGSIAAAVERGVLTRGIMYECVRNRVPFVLAGSIRDDGPLPDVITDVIEAQRAMRRHIQSEGGVALALLMGTTLHAIAVGNLLPASVLTVCVDINPSVVTKLLDRGSLQTAGLVIDAGSFLRELAHQLRLPE
ncbi:MAG: TIGR00300 family protein [Chloroflexota bacterium]|nr:TIGR00300 family protein [Chloroflexota bacterium]